MGSFTIENVVDLGLCTGCGLCEALGSGDVKMTLSKDGDLRPATNLPYKTNFKNFELVCPGVSITRKPSNNYFGSSIWGPIRTCQTGYSTDLELRQLGSSGGVISALAAYLLDTKKVNFVAQISVDPDDPIGTKLQLSRTKADVLQAAGSRYAPSSPLAQILELLETGEVFAFIGKPCDIAALRSLAKFDERINQQVRYMLTFMCAGVPSRLGTISLLKKMDMTLNEVKSFRYRGDGWPGKARAVTFSGDVRELDYATSWGSILNRHLQFRCKICPDGTGEFADVVCADAWYGANGYPSFDERDGRSLILGRTSSGEELLREAIRAGAIKTEQLDVNEIVKMQPYQADRKQVAIARWLGVWLALGHAPNFKNMGLFRASLSARPLSLLRNLVGTYIRGKKHGNKQVIRPE